MALLRPIGGTAVRRLLLRGTGLPAGERQAGRKTNKASLPPPICGVNLGCSKAGL